MGGSVNLQGGGQYQMPGAGYSGMQGSVNAPQTADQYAATMVARQPQQPTYPQGPFAFDINNPDSYTNYQGDTGATANPWTGQAAPVQAPYYAYGNQTAPMMTASEATAYAPMNIPNMSFARPQFYYPSISNQMAFMQGLGGMGMGLGGMGGYGGYGRFGGLGGLGGLGGFGGGIGYGGYMGMPGYFSGLGAMGSYMPMMQRSYPSFQNQYPALGPIARYQPRDPSRPTAYSPPTTARPAYTPPTPPPINLNPDLNPVSPSLQYISSPDRSDARPSWADPLLPVRRTGPANAAITGTATAVQTPYPDVLPPDVPSYPATPPMLKNQPEPQLQRSPYTPPDEPPIEPPYTPPVQPPEAKPELGPPSIDTPVVYEDSRPDTGLARGQDPFTANVFEP